MNMTLRAVFPFAATGRLLPLAERPEKGDSTAAPVAVITEFLKKSLRFMQIRVYEFV